jgi:hypothetical protein
MGRNPSPGEAPWVFAAEAILQFGSVAALLRDMPRQTASRGESPLSIRSESLDSAYRVFAWPAEVLIRTGL